MNIRTLSRAIPGVAVAKPQIARKKLYQRLFERFIGRSRRRIIRSSILMANLVLLVAVLVFVIHGQAGQALVSSKSITNTAVADPLDQVSSADIAVNVARLTHLDEAVATVNNADSANYSLSVTESDEAVVTKPQIVATALKSRKDIVSYVTVAGDTVTNVAAKFSVTSDTIRWSNGLSGEALPAGKQLFVLPGVNGIIYTVKSGDTPDSLAARYSASKDKIVAYNDAELAGLTPGERIIIPDGVLAPTSTGAASFGGGNFAWGTSAIYGYNGYDYGFCTWYVASRISVPSNWGNANTWDNYAPFSGWTVSTTPRPGAIAQTDAGFEGHVAIVEAVSPDGTQIKFSDMNGLAGWGRVGYSGWVSSTRFQHYIYR